MPVVCGTCHAFNRDSAKFCSGCTGRLSASHASGRGDLASDKTDVRTSTAKGSGELSAGASTTMPRAELEQAVQAFRLPIVWSTIVVVLLLVAFTSWYAGYASQARRPTSAPAVAPMVVASPLAPSAPRGIPDTLVTDDAANQRDLRTTTEAASEAETPAPAPVPRTRAHTQKAPPTKPRGMRSRPAGLLVRVESVAPVAPVEPTALVGSTARVASPRQASSSPLAHCVGFNFFERAICLNNRCAQASGANHPECAEILRQRRLDEARRNPTLIN